MLQIPAGQFYGLHDPDALENEKPFNARLELFCIDRTEGNGRRLSRLLQPRRLPRAGRSVIWPAITDKQRTIHGANAMTRRDG
jgi:hypothetical protein